MTMKRECYFREVRKKERLMAEACNVSTMGFDDGLFFKGG